jgi:PAS domain-containing protein
MGILEIMIGSFGLFIAYTFRRNNSFRVKLGTVYLFPILAGIHSIINTASSHQGADIFVLAFMILSTILYYREVKDLTTTVGFNRHTLADYLDDVPDMIYIKDVDCKYTYANKSFMNTFGVSEDFLLGKGDYDIKAFKENKGERYDFADICSESDEWVKVNKTPRLALESGFINEKYYSFQVYKAPIYTECCNERKHVGYIGLARDLTYNILDHKEIEDLINNKDLVGALSVFCMHTKRYEESGIDPRIKKFLTRKNFEKLNKCKECTGLCSGFGNGPCVKEEE